MKKINIVKKKDDFNRIIRKKEGFNSHYFIINSENSDKTRFGITFVKHIGNAVTRNKLKRRIKSIIDNNSSIYQKNKNYIIIAKKDTTKLKYSELEKELKEAFKKGEKNEKYKNN